ncbi:arsenate reductase ArsC [Geomonas sp.]|uniref:arsenate reductase ArsC n=1 Tax=Geomonas sp. TaxID=2651584 RepID=UPI002B4A148A|nr:arsenate reductase ArsC [Geomonas sp.]HJV36260.1 arsenate reductase ArsC [Geomonas sp.]
MNGKIKVLFVCIHNSARSQMAEAFLKEVGGDRFEVESAGIEPGKLNPIVVEAMKEIGIDISANRTKDVFEFIKNGTVFRYVVTVCDETSAERCPVFPGIAERMHWGFPDPSALQGTDEEKLEEVRKIREAIRAKVTEWAATVTG